MQGSSTTQGAVMEPEVFPPRSVKASAEPRHELGMVLTIWIDEFSKTFLCTQNQATGEIQQAQVMLDGSVPQKKIRNTLRNLNWKGQRTDTAYLIIPSEDALIFIEEFPTIQEDEKQVMAESILQGMMELDQDQHIVLIHDLHQTATSTVCALAVFPKAYLQRIFENLQKLGIKNPRFVIDIVGLWQISGEVRHHGFWGRVVKNETNSTIVVKALKINDGVIRTVRQQFFQRDHVDEHLLAVFMHQLFPEESQDDPHLEIGWHVSTGSTDSPAHLVELCHWAAAGRLIHFEPQPSFWTEHLIQQRKRRTIISTSVLFGSCYLAFILYLTGLALFQWKQERDFKAEEQRIESDYRNARKIEQELTNLMASMDISGNPAELLRQLGENLPQGMVIGRFDYKFQNTVNLNGTSDDQAKVDEYVTELQKNPNFKSVKTKSNRPNTSGPGCTWQIEIPLKSKNEPAKTTTP